MDNNDAPHRAHSGRIFAGLIIIAAGLVMLSDRIGISGLHLSGRFWPVLLIVFGLVRLLDPPGWRRGRQRSRWAGAWFVYLGMWGLVSEFQLFGFDYSTSWPLLIVGAGVGMVWRAFEGHGNRPCARVRESCRGN